ncbi:MAG: hypothetical protein M3083_23970 [Actinomycetota bacterium]|nr:hypothetical protein [Actinomycetota bacterium]
MSDRFRFALEHIQPSHWQIFEYLASTFLSDEYGTLRTLASPSGDGGRDAMLFQPTDDETVALQYSVTKDWKAKIRQTVQRLSTTHPCVQGLIFASPFRIGAEGDEVRRSSRRDYHIYVDIRDQNWFTEREERSASTRSASERLSSQVVDSLLRDARIVDHGGVALTSDESRAALLYLVLQRQDDSGDRGLTKLCFDAVVKAILRNTHNENRMGRHLIHEHARILFPSHDSTVVTEYVDRALERMDKRFIRHYTVDDTWLLNYDERTKIAEGVARLALLDAIFMDELGDNLTFVADSLAIDVHIIDPAPLLERARRVLERFLYERGERFADAVTHGQAVLFAGAELEECVNADLLLRPDTSSLRENVASLLSQTIERTLITHSESAQRLLRAVVDGYTLFAFMLETPNVQSAVTKLFSQGEFWIDTTALLPMMAERLLPEINRSYTHIIRAAIAAGARFYVTSGVLNELASHIEMSYQAWRSPTEWNGRTPFLLQVYVWSGNDVSGFPGWLDYFRGRARPEDDIAMYLLEECRIAVADFKGDLERIPDELRWHSEEYWQEVHERRRHFAGGGHNRPVNPDIVKRLAAHDSETFLGVLERRKGEDLNNPFGYTTWWLTLDGAATRAVVEISSRSGYPITHSPVATFDFLTYYLLVGPARRQLDKGIEQQLPLAIDASFLDTLPRDLLAAAEKARQDVQGQDDRLVRRKIRDHLDSEKIRKGRQGRSGLETIKDDLRIALGGR